MHLMDDPEGEGERNSTVPQQETSHPSSPLTASSSSSVFQQPIRINSILRVTTMFNHSRIGKVVAFDPMSNLVTLHIRGSKSHLTSVALINLTHCREWNVEEESNDDSIETLYPIDLHKLKKRQIDNEMEKKREVSHINLKATRIGQALFRDLKRTMNQAIRWSNNDILINNTVRIVEPYRVENIIIDSTNTKTSMKADQDTKTHLMKLVERFWSDPTKIALYDSSPPSTQNPADSSNPTTTTTTDTAEGSEPESKESTSVPSTPV